MKRATFLRWAAGALLAGFIDPPRFELEEETVLEECLPYIRLTKITGRLEVTEEALAKTQGSKAAFLEWAEEAVPMMREEFHRSAFGRYDGVPVQTMSLEEARARFG